MGRPCLRFGVVWLVCDGVHDLCADEDGDLKMADIAMCDDKDCPSRGQCHRYCAWPSTWQSHAVFRRNGEMCAEFVLAWKHDRTLAQADAGIVGLAKTR